MNCAFLLSSCDSYEDTWDPFFQLLGQYWPDIPFRVYLNTETKQYHPSKPLPFEVITCNTGTGLPWGRRMRRVLEMLPEPYVFHVLDDFFIQSPVRTEAVLKLLAMMEKDPSIASFQLIASRAEQLGLSYFGLQESDLSPVSFGSDASLSLALLKRSNWKTSFNPTLWRKSVFIKWLRPFESIWGFELYGSQRARIWNYPEKVYYVVAPMIYDYLWVKNCSVIINGKWLNEEPVDRFFAEHGIEIDYESRGRLTEAQYRSKNNISILKKYTLPQIIQRCFFRVCSFF